MESAKQVKFSLGHFLDFDSEHLQLTSAQFEAIKHANDILTAIVEVETEFLTVYLSYVELQTELLVAASKISTFGPKLGPESELASIMIGAKLDFGLAVFRRYVDRVESQVEKVTGDVKAASTIEKLISSIYDESKEYRLLYTLRNYSMHRASIAESLSYNFQTDPASGQKFLNLSANISCKTLLSWHFGSGEKSNRLSKRVFEDIRSLPTNERLPLPKYFQILLPKLLSIHTAFRELTFLAQQESILLLDDFTSSWLEKHPSREMESHELEVRQINVHTGETEVALQLSEPYIGQIVRAKKQTEMISPAGPTQVRG
jgi:hypothetical protein